MVTKKKMLLLAATVFLGVYALFAQTAKNQTLPLNLDQRFILPLTSLEDENFQEQLSEKLNSNPFWQQLIAEKRLAVGVVDMSNPYNVRYAAVNGNEMMYAASLPKIAVLLAAEDAITKGELVPTEEILSDMRLMISRSDNQATTRMIDRVGMKKIEQVVTAPEYQLYDMEAGGGLWVGKRYAASGIRNPDPMKGLSHAATVMQVCRFYYLLANGKLINRERSKHMLKMMVNPELHHKFVNSIDQLAPNAKVYRKSGSWRTYHSDSALAWGEGWRKYILVGLADDPAGEQIMRELVFAVEDVLKAAPVLAQQLEHGEDSSIRR